MDLSRSIPKALSAKKKMSKQQLAQTMVGWGFVAVAAILIAVFSFYPMIQAFYLSLHSGMGNNLQFVGIANYLRLFQDATFITAVTNTFTYLIVQVPLMIVLGLVFSVVLNRPDLKGKGFFRTAIFLPAITSLVATSTIFRYLFGQQGLVNMALLGLGIIDSPLGWLTQPTLARIAIIIVITWRWTGYNMIFYLSSLQNVDYSIYEAAKIDGANAIQQFFKITIPMLKPIILFTSITSTIGTLQLFDEVMNITGGGPGNSTLTISQYIYNLSFRWTPDFGYASAVSFAIVIMIVVLSIIQFKVTGDKK
ncbi:MAG: sugar ABC transporter permease [Turicibacter sp.]|nr:sugar ABC transporter permease [Turicibacter sp.]